MIDTVTYIRLLMYLDEFFWERKLSETNYQYYGLTLDELFDNSALIYDYIDIEDFFYSTSNISYSETETLESQYNNLDDKTKLKLLENILTILKVSTVYKERNNEIMNKVIKVLKRFNIITHNVGDGFIQLQHSILIGEGSFAVINKVTNEIYQKTLKDEYHTDSNVVKRFIGEFYIMQKLIDSPYVLTVYEINEQNLTYTMEAGECNLFTFLKNNPVIDEETKKHITFNILNGMQHAHRLDIIHRDLHPGNILKLKDDFVISDFGLGKDLSLETSFKTSITQKNNHIYVDPIGIYDFTRLDKLSDIYSIGKIIDDIWRHGGENHQPHKLSSVVDKCTARDRQNRYELIDDIIVDIEFILKEHYEAERINIVKNDIINGNFTVFVQSYLYELAKKNKISQFIVEYRLNHFAKLISKCDVTVQTLILDSMENTYVIATGYLGWSNYDIFANIAFELCSIKPKINNTVYKYAFAILEGCANHRHYARNLLERLE